MAKRVAVVAVNPVNGAGLFQYLEAFFENGITYRTFAVADSTTIKTNSGYTLVVDDVIANLNGHEDEYDALVFACGDAVPKFVENIGQQYNQDLIAVLREFGANDKILIGHCGAAVMYGFVEVGKGRRMAVHPLAKAGVKGAIATDSDIEIDDNFYTAKTENSLHKLINKVLEALK